MLDLGGFDQGSGLRQMASHTAPRLLGVVHHGDRAAEMSVLWHLCSALQRMGYALSVLDATATETQDNPGLKDMLERAHRPQPAGAHAVAAWPVVPAAMGMRYLLQAGTAPAAAQQSVSTTLGGLFGEFGALVVYADADTLAETLPFGASCPVLALSSDMPSLLSAYKSMKQLVTQAGVKVASIVSVHTPESPAYLARNIAKSLQNCTIRYLKCKVQHFNTHISFDPEKQPDDMRRLAVQLLDISAPADSFSGQLPKQMGGSPAHFLWSH